MANKKITELPAIGAALVGTDTIPVVTDRAGTPTTKESAVSRILTYVEDNATSAGTVSKIVKLDASGDTNARSITGSGGTTKPSFWAARNNSKPVHGCTEDSSQGLWFTTDATVETRAGNLARILSNNGSGGAHDIIGRLRNYSPSGNYVWPAQKWLKAQSATQVGNTAATFTDAFSQTLANGDWSTNGWIYEFECWGKFAATASVDKQVKIILGSTTIFDSGALAVTTAQTWATRGILVRRSSTTAYCVVEFTCSDTAVKEQLAGALATETMASDLTFKHQIKGTNASDVTGEVFRMWWGSS